MSEESKRREALIYHAKPTPGKIKVVPTKKYASQRDLSLAYSPGVAAPCLEIEKDKENAYRYTSKGNLVAVISNGTAVLGLGNIGPEASKPVMEGKGLLFKIFADIDVFDIEVDTENVEEFIQTVKMIAPTFGGINLEDIKAPEAFEIERRLKEELDIPVMHDDQHGTAIISAAALINAVEIAEKKLEDVKIVVSGAGAAAISCSRLYQACGAKRENMVMLDSKGVIRNDRESLTSEKAEFATHRKIDTLDEAMKDADVFIGLSMADIVTPEMLLVMAKDPIVFAMANPNPEIKYDIAVATRKDIIMATGRSDHPNQVNNVLGFPFIFRGALDVRAKTINEEMKLAAVHALAELARQDVPDSVSKAYAIEHSHPELDVASEVEVLFVNGEDTKDKEEPFALVTGTNQVVLRVNTMLGRGGQRGNFTSAPYILTLNATSGKVEIDGPHLNGVDQARKVFDKDKIDWNVSLDDGELIYEQVKMAGKKGMFPYSDLDEQIAIYNAANGVTYGSLTTIQGSEKNSITADSLELQKAKMSYLKLSPVERKELLKWLLDQQ